VGAHAGLRGLGQLSRGASRLGARPVDISRATASAALPGQAGPQPAGLHLPGALATGAAQPHGLPLWHGHHRAHAAAAHPAVRTVPLGGFYVVEIIFERAPTQAEVDPVFYAGVDVGLNNLALLTSNKAASCPGLLTGGQ